MIVAVFISDRCDRYLPACQQSFWSHVPAGLIRYFNVVDDRNHELGMAGAVQKAWGWALDVGADFLWHQEEDFVFDQRIPVGEMRYILQRNPHLAHVVLKRQPWSPEETRAGGIIEMNPDAYTQCESWVEHDLCFSLNPSLIPRRTLELGWPSGPLGVGNESGMTERCLEAGMRFAFYGHRDDPPRTVHVGHKRAEGWRL